MRFLLFVKKMKKLEFFLALFFEFSDNLLSVVDKKSNTVSHSVFTFIEIKET